jgi:16S rRNA (guanine(966)-N(2))-methyltransferase RsmD
MRISAGTAKGRPTATQRLLKRTSDGERLRPTSSKVREAIFDILRGRIEGAGFVDLYAGTGTVGLEALSRGAGSAVFVEPDEFRGNAIAGNLSRFGFEHSAVVIKGRAEEFLARAAERNERYDIFFVDPPYNSDEIEKIVPMIDEMGLLNDDGIVLIEHFFKREFSETIGSLKIHKRYRYGDTMLSLYRKVRT